MSGVAEKRTADWCKLYGDSNMCGTDLKRVVHRSEGVKWCFHCRKRREFQAGFYEPKGLSYYGPAPFIECAACGIADADLFPGWARIWGDE